MRTDAEIIERFKTIKGDLFGTETGDLISFLPFDAAKPYLRDTATAEKWGEAPARDAEAVKERIRDYMAFAWEKANDCRGLSALRNLDHMRAWLWLAMEDDLLARLGNLEESGGYYGKPALREICEHFGWDWRAWDDGEWRNDEGAPFVTPDTVPRMFQ